MAGETTGTQTPQLKEYYGGRRTMKRSLMAGANPGAVSEVSAKFKVKTAPGKKAKSPLANRLRSMARQRIGHNSKPGY